MAEDQDVQADVDTDRDGDEEHVAGMGPAETTDPAPEFTELFAGREMDASETLAITRRWPTRLIVLAGAEGSGKTTALSSIYERFLQGPFAGVECGGSRSFLGFEKLCHPNRLVSQRTEPTTERTVTTEAASYYHLALRTPGKAGRRHVLFSALSGELYRWARDSREECQKLSFLHRANAIVILLDGERLAAPESRVNAVADAAGLLDSFHDAEMIPVGCKVEFVFSKLDRIRNAGEEAVAFMTETEQKLGARFLSRIPQVQFRAIAARPTGSHEVDELNERLASAFASWTTQPPAASSGSVSPGAPPSDAREFSKFGWRTEGRRPS